MRARRLAAGPWPCDHAETMSVTIQLLGHPRITRGSGDVYRFRSRKSWGLLAYLILSEHAPARSQLASLLFAGADDPVRALRWGLAEIRRALGDDGSVDGDPVAFRLPPGSVVDVQVVTTGTWADAVKLPGLGADLLEGTPVRGTAAFETWLLAQQRHAAAASEAIQAHREAGVMSWRSHSRRACGPSSRRSRGHMEISDSRCTNRSSSSRGASARSSAYRTRR
jgi:hypothetical protein